MTLGELLQYLDENTEFDLLDGSPADSVAKAKDGSHQNPYAAEIITSALEKLGINGADDEIERVPFVKSLAPVRLKYMADDAPVEGFRTVEKVIATTDLAFNEEDLAKKGK
jgi:hypothetical protein